MPRTLYYRYSHVGVSLTDVWGGEFVRKPGGRIQFIWGDFGSSCCERAPVRRPSPNVLSVTFDPCTYGYWNEIDQAQGYSYWRRGKVWDETGVMHLDPPECDEDT